MHLERPHLSEEKLPTNMDLTHFEGNKQTLIFLSLQLTDIKCHRIVKQPTVYDTVIADTDRK